MANDLKIFGVGLNKTGTTTLGQCLRTLGFSHMGTRRDLFLAYREGNLAPIFEVADQYDCFEDWPWPLLYRELFGRYGTQAKYVLTVRRSPEAWLKSLKKHSLITSVTGHCRKLAYGYDYPFGHEAEHLACYDRHNREVAAFFREQGAEDSLITLCWETGDGWPELCGFLGRPVPEGPLPHANPATPLSYFNRLQLQNRRRARFWGSL
ncbi:MAG: sulfotransferase family protein [Qingshengfaniella sp.]